MIEISSVSMKEHIQFVQNVTIIIIISQANIIMSLKDEGLYAYENELGGIINSFKSSADIFKI